MVLTVAYVCRRLFRFVFLVEVACLSGLLPGLALASPLLRCQLTYGGVTRVEEFAPGADPYRVEAVDVDGRFRFKAVVIGDGQRIDTISLYAYYHSKLQPVLLQQALYRAPKAEVSPAPEQLTGRQFLYSPDLERELQYGCAVYEVAR